MMVENTGSDQTVEDSEVERGRSPAMWQRIDQELSAEIASGRWQPGEKLPTELMLAERFQVNRHTIRRAVQSLVQRGMLRVEQGRGTFVQDGVISFHVSRRTRYTENIGLNRREPVGITLQAGDILPPLSVARALSIHPRSSVVMVERLNMAGGMPIGVTNIYWPGGRFSGIGRIMQEATLEDALAKYGVHDYSRASTRVTARMPTAEEARLLQQPAQRPVLLSEAVEVDEAGRPIMVIVTRFASDRVQLVLDSAEAAA